jgi:hypothetical protein
MGYGPVDAPGLMRNLCGLFRAPSSVVEHLTFNQRADGSKPSELTNYSNDSAVLRS